jgi:hypothetical protein
MAQWHGVVTNIKDILFLNPGIYSVHERKIVLRSILQEIDIKIHRMIALMINLLYSKVKE